MSIEIYNHGANLKFVTDGSARLVAKHTVKSIRVIKGTVLKLDGSGCCGGSDYLPYSQVTLPVTASIQELRDLLGSWLVAAEAGDDGGATETRQVEAIDALQGVNANLTTVGTNISQAIINNLEDKATAQNQLLTIDAISNFNNDIGSTITNGFSDKATEGLQVDQLTELQSANLTLAGIAPAITTSLTDNLNGKATATHQLTQISWLSTLADSLSNLNSDLAAQIDISSQDKATESKQDAQITTLQSMITLLSSVLSQLNQIALDRYFRIPARRVFTETSVEYQGYALPGVQNNQPMWAICKMDDNSGVLTTTWAGGTQNFVHAWDDYLILPYA